MLLNFGEHNNLPLTKFESMLKTNDVYFFDSEDFEQIIHYYLNNGKVALAKKALNIGLAQHPTSVELRLLQVEVLVFENKFDLADKMLDELQTIESSNEEIYIQRANILSKQDQHEDAIEFLKLSLAVADDVADIYSLIGMEYLFLENYTAAKEYFMKCLEIDAEDYTALYNIIYCFDFLEDADGAIEYLNVFIDSNPYCEVAWHQLGKQYFSKKMYKEALAAFDFAIISDDVFIGAYLEKGKVLEKLERYNEAIVNYEHTLTLDDPTSFAYLRIGMCHEKLGNLDLAKKHYYQTVHEDPLLDKGWTAITDFYYKQGNYQKALYYINKAISIDTENILYWKRSAEINKQLQFFEEADVAYQKVVELGNYELITWVSWADILVKLGEYDSAIQALLQGLEFYPDNHEIEYRLAGIYYLIADAIKGKFHLTNALRNNAEEFRILSTLFPTVFERKTVKNIITEYKKTSA
jgi:tetratricopeptide (TPR) repeat protein